MDTYEQTVWILFRLLSQALHANTFLADDWQESEDANKYAEHLKKALIELAGDAIVNHFLSTHRVDMTLATRYSGGSVETHDELTLPNSVVMF